jgi:nicotinamide mononucleotide transporter
MLFSISAELWEGFAVLLGLIYVTLAARHNRLAWFSAFANTSIYAVLFWQDQLPMQTLLNAYFMLAAIYGWFHWKNDSAEETEPVIIHLTQNEHLFFIVLGTISTVIIGYVLSLYALSQQPYLDTLTTIFAMINTWLMLHNKLESWLYWIAIDVVNLWLFASTGHEPTLILYAVYIVLSVYGYINWRKYIKKQNS